MRVALSLTILCLFLVGCRTDPRCSRQTALLRAEILDLEDKYFLLKSQHDSNLGQLDSLGVSIDGGMLSSGPIVSDEYYDGYGDGELIYQGDVILEGASNAPLENSPEGGVIYDEGIVYDGGIVYQNAPMATVPRQLNSSTEQSYQPNYSARTPEVQSQEYSDQVPEDDAPVNRPSSLLPELEDVDSDHGIALTGPSQEIGYSQPNPGRIGQPEITEVVINRSASRGHDVDGQPGDEGIDLLIQPRTADGQIQLVGGELTVSVVDPEQAPERQRIGLWKFLPQETELFFANDELGSHGILLHLPWEQSTPANERLIVHVRFVTPDGRIMKTSSEIRIVPPGPGYSADDPLVAGWTKRDSRWGTNVKQKSSVVSANSDWRQRSNSAIERGSQSASFRNRGSQQNAVANQDRFQRPVFSQQVSQPIPNSNFTLDRQQVPAIPANASIQSNASIEKPAWRPVR